VLLGFLGRILSVPDETAQLLSPEPRFVTSFPTHARLRPRLLGPVCGFPADAARGARLATLAEAPIEISWITRSGIQPRRLAAEPPGSGGEPPCRTYPKHLGAK
jgi:hypothetical protein